MKSKLTLVLDRTTIDDAKSYARSHETSLSRMVEGYFRALMDSETSPAVRAPIVSSLFGIAHLPTEQASLSAKQLVADALAEKYK